MAAERHNPTMSAENHQPSAAGSEPPPSVTVSRDELVELVRAIQFGKPQLSQTKIHKEITQQLSQHEGYEFLSQVKISEVKKVWKILLKEQHEGVPVGQQQPQHPKSTNADLLEKLQGTHQPPQLYTVGDANTPSIAVLARNLQAATLAAAEESTQAEKEALHRDYVHIFLNIPMDQSGTKPHQALINFQPGNPNNKKSNKTKLNQPVLDEDGRLIVKIQRAAPTSDTDTTQHPMLLYDESRTRKTFVHPGEEYDRILKWMVQAGQEGALGNMGGSKAYFYARWTVTNGGLPDIVSVDVTQLAPMQQW